MDSTRHSLTPLLSRARPWKGVNRLPAWVRVGVASIPIFFLALFYAWPLLKLVTTVISTRDIQETLTQPGMLRIIGYTFFQAALSTIATLIVGIGPAYLLARWEFAGRRLVSALITIPFMLPTVVVSSAFIALLPENLHNTTLAIIIVHVFFNVTVVVRIVGTMWAQIPRDLSGAAHTLGANQLSAVRSVTMPLLTPSIMAASAIIFLFTFTSFGVIQIIGGPSNPTIEIEIARKALALGDVGGAAVLALIQLSFLVLIIALSTYFARRTSHELTGHNTQRRTVHTAREKLLIRGGALAILITVLAPLSVLVLSSFRVGDQWSTYAWTHLRGSSLRPGLSTGVDPLNSMGVSFRYMIVATFLSLFIGMISALAISIAQHKGKLIDVGFMLPLGTSAVTIGFGMLITFSAEPYDWRGSWWLVPVGHSLIAIPFVVRTLVPILRARPQGWIDAASTLGASPLRALTRIDIARLGRPLRVSAGVAAAISLGEFGATTFLTRSESDSMPIAIGKLLARTGDIPRAQAFMLATVLAVVTSLIIIAIEVRDA